ncbi:TetR family transcriptional regulator [Marivirga lumbricoides]|uniref:TetR family transcriptional regulator n=2 Tax=Marivirga lumbricoides TaxID=1046115 RepID=A0ABQ1LM66_9BACT|nr:TetR family transcriptional regulator [Marivirga lumbricoides]
MRNAEITKEKILSEAAALFNVKGFKATSLSDITTATGFTKGAIYRHFTDKEDLEEHAYEYMSERMQEKFKAVIKTKNNAADKLKAICSFFYSYIHSPVIEGGCPILNAGVESDDTKPGLNKKVINLLEVFQGSLEHIVRKGIEYGQLKPSTDPVSFSTVFVATLEGAVLLSKIRNRNKEMKIIIKHLETQIELIKI